MAAGQREASMPLGEILFLTLVVAAFVVFMVVLASVAWLCRDIPEPLLGRDVDPRPAHAPGREYRDAA
jgi:hypothetical protein